MNIIRPNRVTRSYTQHYIAPPEAVLPLMCPVREADWIEDWDPIVVFSHSGVAEIDCVFVTGSSPYNAVWYVTRLEPANGLVEMLKITPTVTACKLTIQLAASARGTDATVTYMHTSLGPDGDALIAGFTEEYYEDFMREWETQVNHYISTGAALSVRD